MFRKRGMLTSNVAEGYGFIKTNPELEFADIEIIFTPVAFIGEGLLQPPEHGLTVGAILLQPQSSGTISLSSKDPLSKAMVDPQYLTDPAGKDRETLIAGLTVCEKLFRTEAFAPHLAAGYLMPENADHLGVAELIDLAINRHAQTLYHPVGTARMGLDQHSVVDPELRVRGVAGLRVADASIMPNIIRGHTNAASIVIGEKAAELLRAG
ncbi:GMC family oxidoreductase [Renibacterium salmoninarum ATCC 33209]|uniref:GMC family oxidoreductase n=2 Tax=Renibacterium salmoninarum TaxID=1646 RepID=A9WN32_RENSM|nr:GMC family oxidoreductase [Renibacterium salmoninarum ATCC 33209]